MGLEIERKFLVSAEGWRAGAAGVEIVQGYLSTDPARVVRVRLASGHAWLTIKGRPRGASRAEFEYEVPPEDARALLALCERPLVEKTRYVADFRGRRWEVDVFGGANQGLVVAEIELEHPEVELELPPWVGAEVTLDPRYANAALVERPFSTWREPR